MPRGLRRYHESGQSHLITFSCYRRQPNFVHCATYDLFSVCPEETRRRFNMRVYRYVVMPEHVHLLLGEPGHGTLAAAMHYLKLSFTKRLRRRTFRELPRSSNFGAPGSPLVWANLGSGSFSQKRCYDRNVRDARNSLLSCDTSIGIR